MSYTARDFIAEQLRATSPGAEWNAAGHDRAQELAAIFERNGVRDLSRLMLVPVTVRRRSYAWMPEEVTEGYAFDYEGRKFGFMGTPDRADNTPMLEASGAGFLAAWSAVGHGHINYVTQPRAGGGFEVVPKWGSSSDLDDIRADLLTVGSIALSFALPAAGVNAAGAIGQAVLPSSVAAAYPALANSIGNVALSAAFGGGDIGAAVERAALQYVGGVAGGVTGGALAEWTDVQAIGAATAAATRAFISGGDARTAAVRAFINTGAPELADALQADTKGQSMDFDYSVATGDPTAFLQPSDIAFSPDMFATGELAPIDTTFGAGYGNFDPLFGWSEIAQPSLSFDAPLIDWNFDLPTLPAFDLLEPIGPAPTVYTPAASPAVQDADGLTFREIVVNSTQAVQAALQISSALAAINSQWSDRPTVLNRAQTVAPNGSVTTALRNGYIAQRDASGRVTYTRPSPNTVQATADGGFILNRGDGTFTYINAQGQQATQPYGPTPTPGTGTVPVPVGGSAGGALSSLLSSPVALLGVGALAFLALRRR